MRILLTLPVSRKKRLDPRNEKSAIVRDLVVRHSAQGAFVLVIALLSYLVRISSSRDSTVSFREIFYDSFDEEVSPAECCVVYAGCALPLLVVLLISLV